MLPQSFFHVLNCVSGRFCYNKIISTPIKVFFNIRVVLRGYPLATSIWSLFLVASLIFFNQFVFARQDAAADYEQSIKWNSGGPIQNLEDGAYVSPASLLATNGISFNETRALVADDASLVSNSPVLSNLIPDRNGLKKYKVRKGDTLSGIAAEFGLDLDTLRLANPEFKGGALRVGQELTVLPVPGLLYEIKDGDSLQSVANRYQTDPDLIKHYNPDYQKLFESAGRVAILPYAKPKTQADYVNRYVKGLLDLKNYFVLPTRGWNWGELHEYNAVDIANQCGRPIYASAEGLVIPDEKLGDGASGWNNGYGLFILLEHPNGTRTRYAHNLKNLAKPGDYVKQGDEIALIGNTGNTHGPSGCHLHFEVFGARNPFAIR